MQRICIKIPEVDFVDAHFQFFAPSGVILKGEVEVSYKEIILASKLYIY